MLEAISLLLVLIIVIVFWNLRRSPGKKPIASGEMIDVPAKWKVILNDKVHFYRNLNQGHKLQFEQDVYRFLQEIKVTGVQTDVTLTDRLLVAASAVIPLFGFPEWNYKYLDEVLLYPSAFNRNFDLVANASENGEYITGMVGSGAMENKMILSKPSLHLGFSNHADKKNVGIHEFVHLFDKEDGCIDALPTALQDEPEAIPWMNLIYEKTKEIVSDESDINRYGASSPVEFFAVTAEYFFERPHLLKKKHPELYTYLSQIFSLDMTRIITLESFDSAKKIGRNDPCPCGSGKKFKRCCI